MRLHWLRNFRRIRFQAIWSVLLLLYCAATSWADSNEQTVSNIRPKIPLQEYRLARQEATRFLWQSSFGPTVDEVDRVLNLGIEGWIDQQFEMPLSQSQLSRTIEIALMAEPQSQWFDKSVFNASSNWRVQNYQSSAWWEQALTAPDQLRQRVAYALSQIVVVSTTEPPLHNRAEALAVYNDLLLKHAYGNYRELLSAISYSPAMGIYLSHQGNRKENPKKQTSPDENFARELMQLFSVGLYKTGLDGIPVLDENSKKIPAYSQHDVMELARVFTGWDLVGNDGFGRKGQKRASYLEPMEFTDQFHDFGGKNLLGYTIPEKLDGKEDVEAALDILFMQPTVAPFVSKRLIQRLVTSNPSPQYIQRVSLVFENNGTGIRGDMKAVVKTILTDQEARFMGSNKNQQQLARKLKEPVVAFSGLLRFLKVQPAPVWTTGSEGKMREVLWFKQLHIGQDPLRSPSVFNFYEADYRPSGESFSANGMVAPEASILGISSLAKYSNLVRIVLINSDLQAFSMKGHEFRKRMKEQRHKWAFNARVDTLSLLQIFELSLEMDTTDDYDSLLNTSRYGMDQRLYALSRVLSVIEDQFLGFMLEEEYRQQLLIRLAQPVKKNTRQEAHRMVSTLLHWLAMSPGYWVER